MKDNKGFTLIEVMAVIAIIGSLSSIALASLNNARAKARDSQRISNIGEIKKALDLYHFDYGVYPISVGTTWMGNMSDWGSYATIGVNGYIPGLAPSYIAELPVDPKQTSSYGYLYKSDGVDYFFIAYGTVEGSVPDSFKRPSAPDSKDFAIYTEGFADSVVEPGDVITQLTTPISSPASGSTTMVVQLFGEAGSTIYYTKDGTNPTRLSSIYLTPIIIPPLTSVLVKAIAVKDGYTDSDIFSGTFTGPPSCFLPGTMIKTTNADISIENILPGQHILAFSGSEQIVSAHVISKYKSERDYYYTITTENSSVSVTAEHPFYVGNSRFTKAQSLKEGDTIYILSNNQLISEKIISNERINSRTDVYNLSITAPNTFFANNFAVHNAKAVAP